MAVTAHDDGRHLGAQKSPPDHRDLLFADFVKPTIALPAPLRYGHRGMSERLQPWHMLANGPDDSVSPGFGGCGDCVVVEAFNQLTLVNATHGAKLNATGKEAVKTYSAVTGYVVGDDSTDQGTDPRSMLSYLQRTGIVDADGKTHKIGAYFQVNLMNDTELLQAIHVCEAFSLGFSCPDDIFDQFDAGQWEVVPGQTTSGDGHCVCIPGHRSETDWAAISWAAVPRMTLEYMQKYGFELWGFITQEQLLGTGKTIDGFLYADLLAAVNQLKLSAVNQVQYVAPDRS